MSSSRDIHSSDDDEPAEQYPSASIAASGIVESRGGIWGRRSKKEICVVVAVSLLALSALIVALALTTGNDDGGDNGGSSLPAATGRPVEPVVEVATAQAKLNLLRQRFGDFDATSRFLLTVPKDAAELTNKHQDVNAAPEIRAASWSIQTPAAADDKKSVSAHNEQYQLVRRFALATVYYNHGGETWTDATNWLSLAVSHCDWKGVTCCRDLSTGVQCNLEPLQAVAELDLRENNLTGPLSDVLILLRELQSFNVAHNAVTGGINSKALRELPNLQKLYLNDNQLTGTIAKDINKSGKLGESKF